MVMRPPDDKFDATKEEVLAGPLLMPEAKTMLWLSTVVMLERMDAVTGVAGSNALPGLLRYARIPLM